MGQGPMSSEDGALRAQAGEDWRSFIQSFDSGESPYFQNIDDYLTLSSFLDIPKGDEESGRALLDARVEHLRVRVLGVHARNPSDAGTQRKQDDEHSQEVDSQRANRTKRLAYFCLQHHYRACLDTDLMRNLMEDNARQDWFQMGKELVADDFLLIEPHLWYFLDSDQTRETGTLDVPRMPWLDNPAKVAKKVADFVDQHPFPPLLHLYALTVADLWAAYSEDEWTQALPGFGLSGPQRWLDLRRDLNEDGQGFPKWAGDTPAPLVQALVYGKRAIRNWQLVDRSGVPVWWSEPSALEDDPVHPRYFATEARIRSLLGEAIGREPYNDERTAREQFRMAGAAIDRAIASQRVAEGRGALLIAEFRSIRGEVQLRRTALDIEVRASRMIQEAAARSQAEAQAAVENSKKEFIQLLGLLSAILAFLLVSVNIATKWSTVEQAIALIGGAGLFLVFGSFSWSLFVMQPKLDRAWLVKVLIGGLGLAAGAGIVALLLNVTPQGNIPTERPTPSPSAVAQP